MVCDVTCRACFACSLISFCVVCCTCAPRSYEVACRENVANFEYERAFRWIGEQEAIRCATAFSEYTAHTGVMNRADLFPLLIDLGYPVASNELCEATIKEFMTDEDNSPLLLPEYMHILRALGYIKLQVSSCVFPLITLC